MAASSLSRKRAVVSSVLFITFFPCVASGLTLLTAPSGRVARETGWTFAGFTREALESIHRVTGIIMGLAVLLHIVLNWRWYGSELRALFEKSGRR